MQTELQSWREFISLAPDLRAPDIRLELAAISAAVKCSRIDLARAVVDLCGAIDALNRLPVEVLRDARGRP